MTQTNKQLILLSDLYKDFYVVDKIIVKKGIRCTINGNNYAFCGFKSIESVMAWNYLYLRMLERESNYDEFSWQEMCKDLGFELDQKYCDSVLKSLLKVSIVLEVRRFPFIHIRIFNAMSTRKFKDGTISFALTLSNDLCRLEADFQQTIYQILIENIQKSYAYPDDIEKIREIARKQCSRFSQNCIMDIDVSGVSTSKFSEKELLKNLNARNAHANEIIVNFIHEDLAENKLNL